jgi:hypothetical protein
METVLRSRVRALLGKVAFTLIERVPRIRHYKIDV